MENSVSVIIGRFEKSVSDFIRAEALPLREGDRVLVALSGGADSVALLRVLISLGMVCSAAHCNFHLRGEESDRDARHCEDLCRKLGVRLFKKNFDVPGRMKQTGESCEMACRSLRYEWFAGLLGELPGAVLAVGHHREDQAETVILNLLRGTGIDGIAGMKAVNGNILRPLLGVSREDIEAYVSACGLSYIVDSSNNSDAFKRNRIRNRLLPVMEELFPGAIDGILRSSAVLNRNRLFYNHSLRKTASAYYDGTCVRLADMVAAESFPAEILYGILSPLMFNATHVENILSAPAGASGLRFYSTDGRLVAELDRGILRITDRSSLNDVDEVCQVSLEGNKLGPLSVDISRHDVDDFAQEGRDAKVLFLDCSALEGNPMWELRPPRRGDRMIPFGMKGSRLLSDIFSDAKLSAQEKRSVRVLTRNGCIVWIPGIRTSAHFAVNETTESYIRIKLLNN